MKYYIKTYGCQMNIADSDSMSASLINAGFSRSEEIADADILIVNTCAVRHLPEQKAYSFLGRAKPFKKQKPSLKIIVAGCMAERAGKEIRKRFPIVDLIVGAKDIERFPELLKSKLAVWSMGRPGGAPGIAPGKAPDTEARKIVDPKARAVSSFVTIMRGCENYCSYCVVPFVRGPEISKPSEQLLSEIECLARDGVREVTLLGQNVNSYRDDSAGEWSQIDFPGLLEKINGVKGLERVRFMTSHPKDIGDNLIEAMANLQNICEHLHMPLQSGSDPVLQRMNRKYTASDYMRTVEKARKIVPELSVTTDILVGFPGETEDDHKETLKVIKAAGFDSLFAFKYSPRPGTGAYKLKDDVSLAEKENRLKEVLETGNSISCEKNAKLINGVQEILVDSCQDGICEGRTRTNKKVSFPSGLDLTGKIVKVTLTEVKINSLTGRLEQVLR